MGVKAAFLDRDGVLIKDNNLIKNFSEVDIYPGAANAVAQLRQQGYKTFLVSNQTVVSRGILSFAEMQKLNQAILSELKKQNAEATFDEVYLCPHHPSATVEEYRKNCECRKPKAGSLFEAQKSFDIDLKKSLMIGDRLTDVYAGKQAGCQSFLLKTGAHEHPLIETNENLNPAFLKPDQSFNSLSECVQFIETAGFH